MKTYDFRIVNKAAFKAIEAMFESTPIFNEGDAIKSKSAVCFDLLTMLRHIHEL
eukprot:CAMPEP_0170501996 /NCGR_PEP_ID=MMETSP0208-20121228/40178_1 /TAXON_ID=197538 /ORGANISM="Strombidium inclinatum, Strain S3" /LENGTH=53 /DNA_ID=CAMNT_0010780849 /DNA_START=222 /DNA_END=383 /DNA_ORIENTATION=+